MMSKLVDIICPSDIEGHAGNFTSRLIDSASANFSETSGKRKMHKNAIWWDRECEEAVLKRRHAWKTMIKHPIEK